VPFTGEFGISKNPESFASEAYRAYFTDKIRGKVLRLSRDGLTPISDAGMKDWFRDNLKLGDKIIGSYDDRQDEYNVTIKSANSKVVTFNESVKGWVSFKSFIDMEHAMSMGNNYYTFKDGKAWKHHVEGTIENPHPRNMFYDISHASTVNVLLNDISGSIKNYQTLNYEGSQSRIRINLNDDQYYNLKDKDGWWVEKIITDQQNGGIDEFIEKEGKWFNYIKGTNKAIGTIPKFDEFSSQGIGFSDSFTISTFGCTDPTATNYDANATVDDGSCVECVYGCMETWADNYDSNATCDDGSCVADGCTDRSSINYNPNATSDDGTCIPQIIGCMDSGQSYLPGANGELVNNYINYSSLNNTDCEGVVNGNNNTCCIPAVYGCMNSSAFNYNPSANIQSIEKCTGNLQHCECIPAVLGCTDPGASNFNPAANTSDGSCVYGIAEREI